MLSDPGSRFDFGTLIAYLIPGYMLEALGFCIVDSMHLLIAKSSLVPQINWTFAETALVIGTLTICGYILGLLFDMIAHPITLEHELKMKNDAYKIAVNQFKGFIKNREINNILISSDKDTADTEKRNLFIDSMFYRLATTDIWARQNWHWAFYEFSRQMYLLCLPGTIIVSFYVTLFVLVRFHTVTDITPTLTIALGVVIASVLVTWLGPRRLLQKARDADCRVYYRHRAWTIFAYLIETNLLKKDLSNDKEDDISNVGMRINTAPITSKTLS